ncbi:EAL domain-containing protein [Secundilactobacillus muriivasis]
MYTFYGQPKFALADSKTAIGYELFIREYQGDRWTLPDDFDTITSATIETLLNKTVQKLPTTTTLLSFNLEQNQFVDPEFAAMVARIQATTSINIYTELTERKNPNVTDEQLFEAAERFERLGLLVCIDDVGTAYNTPSLVGKLDEYVDEYKFALQNLRPFKTIQAVVPQIKYWYAQASKLCKTLVIEGIESKEELEFLQQYFPCDIVQGYYLGKPSLLEI